jgi:hypothetical protein
MGFHGCFCITLRTTSICKHRIINRKQFEKQTDEIDMIRKKFYISTRPCNRSPESFRHGPHIPIRALQNSILFHHHVNYSFTTLRTKLGTCHYLSTYSFLCCCRVGRNSFFTCVCYNKRFVSTWGISILLVLHSIYYSTSQHIFRWVTEL